MVAVGDNVNATDYNGFVTRINDILGIGSGNKGYGQAITSSHVADSNVTDITNTQWNLLRADINLASNHQTGADSSINQINAGNIIGADASNTTTGNSVTRDDSDNFTIVTPDANKGVNDFGSEITDLEADPLTVDSGNLSAENKLAYTDTGMAYTSNWGASGDLGIYLEFDVTFAGGYNCKDDAGADVEATASDHRRHFFNAGGEIQIKSDIANGNGSQKDNDWNTLVGNTGTISMGSTATTSSIGGSPAAVGFWDLTTTYTTIFTKNGSQAEYAENYYRIRAKLQSTNAVRFEVLFQDADEGDQRPNSDAGGGGAEGVPPNVTPQGPAVDEPVTADVRVNTAQLRPTGAFSVPTPTHSVARNLGP